MVQPLDIGGGREHDCVQFASSNVLDQGADLIVFGGRRVAIGRDRVRKGARTPEERHQRSSRASPEQLQPDVPASEVSPPASGGFPERVPCIERARITPPARPIQMRRVLRFLIALVLGLALVTWAVSGLVQRTTRDWFRKDVSLRAQLAVVNPYDLDEASSAMAAALRISTEERRDRMRSMRAFVSEFNVYRWAGRMLVDAARLRSRDRLTGRLTDHLTVAAGATR